MKQFTRGSRSRAERLLSFFCARSWFVLFNNTLNSNVMKKEEIKNAKENLNEVATIDTTTTKSNKKVVKRKAQTKSQNAQSPIFSENCGVCLNLT